MAVLLLSGCTAGVPSNGSNTTVTGSNDVAVNETASTGVFCSIVTTTVNTTYFPTIEEMQTRMNAICADYCIGAVNETSCVDSEVNCKC